MIAPRENFRAARLRACTQGTLWAAVRCSDHMNFPALIEPMLRGHFI
jgi:hypothetical protein